MQISEVWNGDNMEYMAHFPDKFFDLAISDPPYFSGPEKRGFYGNKHSSDGVKRGDYPISKNWELPTDEYFKELFRVSKSQIVWGCNYYNYQFGPGRIVWDKVNEESSFSDCEIAYCSKHNSVRLFRFMWNGMMQGKNINEGHIQHGNKKLNEKRIHPTQKPVSLYKWILKNYAKTGDKILDTHLGSGSSRIAAYQMWFDFYGCELDKEYFDASVKRFEIEILQKSIFTFNDQIKHIQSSIDF